MDHDKLIEESANIFGRSLVTPTTETSNLQERGAVARVLRKVTGKLAGKVTASNAEAAAKAQRKAGAEKLGALSKDKRRDPEWEDVTKPAIHARSKVQSRAERDPAKHGGELQAHDASVAAAEAEAKTQRGKARDYLKGSNPGPTEKARRRNLAGKIGKEAAWQKKYPPEA